MEYGPCSSAIPKLPATSKITSLQNRYIQHCVKLRTKRKYREANQSLLLACYPTTATRRKEFAIAEVDLKIKALFLREEGAIDVRRKRTENIFYVNQRVMQKLSGVQSASSIRAVAEVEYPTYSKDWSSTRVLALDGVQDPGNLGSLTRSCVCFNWGPILLLPNCCDPFNEKVLRAARGATFKVPLLHTKPTELPHILSKNDLLPVATTSHVTGRNLDQTLNAIQDSPENGICLFLGSEGRGLASETESLCSMSVSIPQSDKMESLNVAVAGGILMYLIDSAVQRK